MRIVAIALVLAGCFTKPPRPDVGGDAATKDGPTAEGWLTGYQARKRVDISPPTTAALVDFPIVIAPAVADPDVDLRARADGRDLVVTAVDGVTRLRSELVGYKDGLFEIWVNLPMLADDLSIWLYYGSSEGVSPDPLTWSSQFAGVWHMSAIAEETDSTPHATNLSAVPTSTPASVAGKIGSARSFDGGDSLFGGTPSALDFGTESFSFSLWANVSLPTLTDFGTGFFKGGTNGSEPGFCWLMGNQAWTTKLHDGTDFVEAEIGPASNFGGDWVHLTTVVNRTTRTLTAYVDGAPGAFNSIDVAFGTMTTSQPFELSHNSGGEVFAGLLDEVRIYAVPLTADWVETEFANQSRAPSFLQLQPEELAP